MAWQGRPERQARERRDLPDGGRITAIPAQERDPGRVSVFLDGRFAFGLGTKEVIEQGLHVGDDLTPDRVAALRALDEADRAAEAAVRLLGRRPRSVRELRDRLRQRGFAPEAIDAAIARLEGWGYVDDEEFARFWVENRERHKPRGRRLLEQELRRKGVDRETVRETIDAADLDETATALDLGQKKLASYAGLEPQVVRRRLGGYLTRRGYSYDTVRLVLDRLLTDVGDDENLDAGEP